MNRDDTPGPAPYDYVYKLHPDRFCRSEIKRGCYTWVCYGPPGHAGPHAAGNSDNEPIYRKWFDVVKGGEQP